MTISERLRTEVNMSSSTVSPLRLEAADVIDALAAALEEARDDLDRIGDAGGYHASDLVEAKISAALAKARQSKP